MLIPTIGGLFDSPERRLIMIKAALIVVDMLNDFH
jgi:hypothetical protein